MRILPNDIHPSWKGLLTDETREELKAIDEKIGDDINPEPEKVMRFLQSDLDRLKVVILGQDPYPEKGRATGRSFEVGDLHDWNDKFRQVSLKNIIRLIYKNYNDITEYKDIKKFSDIQKEIKAGKFNILPPDELFSSWEAQGVLMLNTYLTVRPGEPGSHTKIWEPFSNRLIEYISTQNKNICWFLWGSKAEEKKLHILDGKLYISRHPMMCNEKYTDDFLLNNCFKDTMNEINWLGAACAQSI